MKKTILLICIFFLAVLVSYVSAAECSVAVVEDCTVSANTILDGYPYYLNDTAGNGSIIIIADNVELDCNGTTLIGNSTEGSRGIQFAVKDNVTIKNCFIQNYSRGINFDNSNYALIFNNTFDNITNRSIYARYIGHDNNISSNTITMLDKKIDTKYNGIFIDRIINTTIEKNIIFGSYYQISASKCNYSIIKSNYLINATNNGIYDDRGRYGIITDNNGTNITWNFIDINSFSTNVTFNRGNYIDHNGIDLFSSFQPRWSSNNKIYGNNISNIKCGGILAFHFNNTEIYDNIIENVSGVGCSGSVVYGIQISANSTIGTGARVYNNTIKNITEFSQFKTCIFSGIFNTTIEENKLSLCGDFSILTQNLNNNEEANATYKNNIYDEGTATYWIGRNSLNHSFSVNEYSTSSHFINFSNGGTINLSYNGDKNFNVTGNSIRIIGLFAPYNDIYNKTGHFLIASNVNEYNITINPNEEIIIGEYICGKIIIRNNTQLIFRN